MEIDKADKNISFHEFQRKLLNELGMLMLGIKTRHDLESRLNTIAGSSWWLEFEGESPYITEILIKVDFRYSAEVQELIVPYLADNIFVKFKSVYPL